VRAKIRPAYCGASRSIVTENTPTPCAALSPRPAWRPRRRIGPRTRPRRRSACRPRAPAGGDARRFPAQHRRHVPNRGTDARVAVGLERRNPALHYLADPLVERLERQDRHVLGALARKRKDAESVSECLQRFADRGKNGQHLNCLGLGLGARRAAPADQRDGDSRRDGRTSPQPPNSTAPNERRDPCRA
jgi:hypothetical protein